ncbi:hypothetical protein L7F22_056073 [Adiantum nelumboides]|nr:hypothetical protein [Adiantum nelumboides]
MIWYFDSGASRHITSRKDLFSSLDAAPAGKKVTCANNASYPIKGVGKILITISDGSDLCLPDVLYVPGIKKNLLSVSSLAKNGLRVIFEDDRCIVRDRENGYSLITTGTLENGLFVLDRYEKQIQACIAETKTQAMQDAELWHARFGHVGYDSLMTLQRHNMVHDLSLLEMPPRHVCEGCVLGKMHRFAFSQDGSVRATRKLQLVHSDVCGPMRTPSVGNSLYFVTFIDDFSRFCWVYPLKAKSDVFAVFQHYVSMVENETGCKVQTLRTDRGGEYMSGAFKDFLGKKGIKHQCTMPYTPQQNGVAERKNRSLMEMARCMLKAKSLPHKLWMEAVACAAHVLNRCPTRALKTITPYESWYDRKPSVSYLRVFGCLAYAHIPQQLRGKLDDKAVKCIFVGYSSGSKGYRLYNPATNKIFESRDVIFVETTAQPMVAFDVPHMQTQDVFEGFLPSFVENQESQQVDNFDQSFDQHVTPHDVEEIVHEEQEVLREEQTLPKWVQKTLQDSKLDAPLPRKTRAGLIFNPKRKDRSTYYSVIGWLDQRTDLIYPYSSKLKVDPSTGNFHYDSKLFADLCMMASKLSYESPDVQEPVVNKQWNASFFTFTDKLQDADLLVFAFRGTEPFNADDWANDFDFSFVELDNVIGRLHLGFLEALGLIDREHIKESGERLKENLNDPKQELTTGLSLNKLKSMASIRRLHAFKEVDHDYYTEEELRELELAKRVSIFEKIIADLIDLLKKTLTLDL